MSEDVIEVKHNDRGGTPEFVPSSDENQQNLRIVKGP